MAKYVYYLPSQDSRTTQSKETAPWGVIAQSFGDFLRDELLGKFGLDALVFPAEDGVELDQGCAGMGKDWFNFKFRVFADRAIYLDMINVPYEWRNKGIGALLIDMLKKFAADNGMRYIFLGSYDPSNPFWESRGFVRITEYPDFVLGLDGMAK